MDDALVAVAGDLVSERKRLAESVRRLESQLASLLGEATWVTSERVHQELDVIVRGLDRVGALAKSLVNEVNSDRTIEIVGLLGRARDMIEAKSTELGYSVAIETKPSQCRIDRLVSERFETVLRSIIGALVEFGVESPKERAARQKRTRSIFQLEAAPLKNGVRFKILCDGNGLTPPGSARQGLELAKTGVRAWFEGQASRFSAWIFHLPSELGELQYVALDFGSRTVCVPAWSIDQVSPLEIGGARIENPWIVDEDLNRVALEPSFIHKNGRFRVDLGAGMEKATFIATRVYSPEELFMKTLSNDYNVRGRLSGVVLREASHELTLVMNPAYLVYGDEALAK